ncbi:MAG: Ig-like domain-containing protein [Bacteriovoracales bacterium]|nr:Ig-like domain-containing protein [Bacteriovoracales bacterium]
MRRIFLFRLISKTLLLFTLALFFVGCADEPFGWKGSDRNGLTVKLSRSGSGTLGAGETETITITFSQAVNGFTKSDLTIKGGTLGVLKETTTGTVWTIVATPAANSTSNMVISLGANAAKDKANNGNKAAGITIAVDTRSLTVRLSRSGSGPLGIGDVETITVTFSEAVSGFAKADLAITGGTLGVLTETTAGTVWTIVATPTADSTADMVISLGADVVQNGSGDGNAVARDLTIAVDTQAPTVTLSRGGSGTLNTGDAETITVTFSEAVSGFAKADLTITGGTLGVLTETTAGTVWTIPATSSGNSNGTMVISLDANAATDGADNGNTAAGNLSIPVNVGLTVTLTHSATGVLRKGDATLVTARFNKVVTGFEKTDMTILGGTLGQFYGSGHTYTVVATPSASSASAMVIGIPENSATDINSINNQAATDLSISVDTTKSAFRFSFERVVGGGSHSCALLDSGQARCWGKGDSGQLGNDAFANKDHPVTVINGNNSSSALTGIVQLTAGNVHTCALLASGQARCWGKGDSGQLGNDATTNKDHPVTVVRANGSSSALTGIVQLAAGNVHTCALLASGQARCWGKGEHGRLGNDAIANKDHPVTVINGDNSSDALTGIVQLVAGADHTCALLDSGQAHCWGKGENGRLGNDASVNKDHPVTVVDGDSSSDALTGIVQLAAGYLHTCALLTSGEVRCWGVGGNGRLGNDDTDNKDHPVTVIDGDGSSNALTGVTQLAGGGSHTCVLLNSGEARCWGQGNNGELGNDVSGNTEYPVAVIDGDGSSTALGGIIQLGAGANHACAFLDSGQVRCWGVGGNGRLGNDASVNKDHPVTVINDDSSSEALALGTSLRGWRCGGTGSNSCTMDTVSVSLNTGSRSPSTSNAPVLRVSGITNSNPFILYSDDTCTSSNRVGNILRSNGTVNITNLTEGTHHYYYAYGMNKCSKSSIAYIYDNTPPSAPSQPTASGSDGSPTVTVGGLTSGDLLKVYASNTSSSSECTDANLMKTARINAVSVDVTPSTALTSGDWYFYATATDDAGNTSDCSDPSALYNVP